MNWESQDTVYTVPICMIFNIGCPMHQELMDPISVNICQECDLAFLTVRLHWSHPCARSLSRPCARSLVRPCVRSLGRPCARSLGRPCARSLARPH